MRLLIGLCAICFLMVSYGQEKITINGYITDAASGESLIGATVLIKELGAGNITNVYGFYSVTVPPGDYTVEYRYIGFVTQSQTISLTENQRLDIELAEDGVELTEVVVTAEPQDQNVTSTEMSVAKLDIKTITKMPAFFGEVDVIKSIQLLPGVSTVGEGASGFNVRGGTVGQNLILLDEAPVYNSSHLLGFFSVFNPDAVKDVKLYKGGIPAQYGGRISSVLDIRMKEGSAKKFDYTGGIGSIFGRFAVEGPIAKDKASFILAGRRSWIDALLKPANVLESDDALNFYDVTLKTNYRINEKNQVFLSGYIGRDVFQFPGAGFNWGNMTGTARWNYLVNDRLFTNFSLIFSEYDYSLEFGEEDDNSFDWDSEIQTIDFKPQASYFINSSNELHFGGQFTYYKFEPANAVGISEGEPIDLSVPEKFAVEGAAYINNEQKVSDRLKINYGIRFSVFNYLGPADVFTLAETEPGRRKEIVGSETYTRGETIESYYTPEPRFSFNYKVNETSSIKGSYNRMAQYIHLISVSTASNPLDLWTPSTNNIQPERGHLYSMGYFKNLSNNKYELSGEVYYREITDQLDYRNGLSLNDLLINEFVERDLLSGESRAYGLELYAKKNSGRFNGWASYTLSKAEIRTIGLNNDDWYAANYDQTHSLKVSGFYELNEKIQLSANFVYNTGRPFTAMDQQYSVGGYTVYHSSNGDRNSKRVPDYHRLDLSATFDLKPRTVFKRDYESSLVVSLYNVYGRRNAFSTYITPGEGGIGETSVPGYQQFSVIGFILPSVTYNFKF